MIKTRRHCGFTLLEIAIVLAVIGLLAGGVMGGRYALRQMNVNAVAREVGDLQNSFMLFEQAYGMPPGDLHSAGDLFGCDDCNGNGNGRVDPEEMPLVWRQLAAAEMLKGIYVEAAEQEGPPSSLGDGMRYRLESADHGRLVAVLGGGLGALQAPLSAIEAKRLDDALDDGAASSGRVGVRAIGADAAACQDGPAFAANDQRQCELLLVLHGPALAGFHWDVSEWSDCSALGVWQVGSWSECDAVCGAKGTQKRDVTCQSDLQGAQTRQVECVGADGKRVPKAYCTGDAPVARQNCQARCDAEAPVSQRECDAVCSAEQQWVVGDWNGCEPKAEWVTGEWMPCPVLCGGGVQIREVMCPKVTGSRVRKVACLSPKADCPQPQPPVQEFCESAECHGPKPPHWQHCNQQACGTK